MTHANHPHLSPTTLADAHDQGLKDNEWQIILDKMGRTPNMTELGIFGVMWSEHCSYKSSKVHLKTLPTTAPWVICGPGENAGVIDIGDGQAAIFKMESHNHPSQIEPFQGSATGVGGPNRGSPVADVIKDGPSAEISLGAFIVIGSRKVSGFHDGLSLRL